MGKVRIQWSQCDAYCDRVAKSYQWNVVETPQCRRPLVRLFLLANRSLIWYANGIGQYDYADRRIQRYALLTVMGDRLSKENFPAFPQTAMNLSSGVTAIENMS